VSDVTNLLDAIDRGEPHAAEQLLPLVYDELRRLAAVWLANEQPGQTLQATALVHEAYLRLVGDGQQRHWDNRGHFFAAAAESMRRILVEAARRKQRDKHGGQHKRINIDAVQPAAPNPRDDLIALDAAPSKLAAEDPQAARLVELATSPGSPSRKRLGCWVSRRARPTGSGRLPGRGCTANSLARRPIRNREKSWRDFAATSHWIAERLQKATRTELPAAQRCLGRAL
jgi:RNA polymerase sigma factor (TIGR02999 family)